MPARDLIESRRLRLIPMRPAFLRASLDSDRERAEQLLGVTLPAEWPTMLDVLRLRLGQLERVPDLEPWLTRAIEVASERRMVGVTGFHAPPGGEWLDDYGPNAVEFGYTVFERDRRRGIAVEASSALMEWARTEHGVSRFVLSIAPDNHASKAVARALDFDRVGEWVHEERGLEHVYLRVT